MKNNKVFTTSALNLVIVLIIFYAIYYFSNMSHKDLNIEETVTLPISTKPTNKPTSTITKTVTKKPSRTPTITPSPIPEDNILYENHFEDNSLSGWENRSNTPLEIINENGNNYLHFMATGFAYPGFWMIDDTSTWDNYVFESQIRLHENGVQICFRAYGKASSFYNVYLDPHNDWVVFADYDYSRGDDDNYQTFNGVAYPIPLNQWIPVRIEVKGENLSVYIDNKLVTSAKRSSLDFGGIGYYTGENTQFDVDDIRVWKLK
jgi:hypothetical protein